MSSIIKEVYLEILTIKYYIPSKFIEESFQKYREYADSQKLRGQQNLNGKVFEFLLSVILFREGILPLFFQAKILFVPNVIFDFVLYSKKSGPLVLSAKTSLRERYKQADLEGMILRQVHRKARIYLITLDPDESKSVLRKISNEEILGIDEVVVATTKEFDNLIGQLKEEDFYLPQKMNVISSSKILRNRSNE